MPSACRLGSGRVTPTASCRSGFRAGHKGRSMASVSDIVAAAGWIFCLTPAQIMSPSRHKRVVRARNAVFAALSRRGSSSGQIGRWMHRDHSTVLHGIRRADEWAAEDPVYAERIRRLANYRPHLGRNEGKNEDGKQEVERGAPGCPEGAGGQADRADG
ncbi:MAG: hypothetical protein CGW95_01550 [Phenylobacterium zucineum]|nr:MAG: hypothetical protein CGW95_01550 [Phenylobacterium zucineum]